MNQVTTQNYKRVSKAQAEKIWKEGGILVIAACKMDPETEFGFEITENREPEQWEAVINSFIYYNCTYETGYYPAFYTSR
jgi:hypothetical protein